MTDEAPAHGEQTAATGRGSTWTDDERSSGARCLNCDTALRGPYCHACGQEDTELAVPLRRLIVGALEDLISLDSRVLRTLRPLLFRPGHLTHEFNRGRRIRYVPPLRLYLFISFFMFIALSLSGYSVVRTEGEAGGTFFLFSTRPAADSSRPSEPTPQGAEHGAAVEEPWIVRRLEAAIEDPEAFNRLYVRHLPTVLFLTLPLLALLIQLLFWRQRRTYAEHSVFALHLMSFAFLLILARSLTTASLGPAAGKAIGALVPLVLLAYLHVSLRRVYAQGRWITLVKTLSLAFLYLVVLTACLFAGMLLVAMLSFPGSQ